MPDVPVQGGGVTGRTKGGPPLGMLETAEKHIQDKYERISQNSVDKEIRRLVTKVQLAMKNPKIDWSEIVFNARMAGSIQKPDGET